MFIENVEVRRGNINPGEQNPTIQNWVEVYPTK